MNISKKIIVSFVILLSVGIIFLQSIFESIKVSADNITYINNSYVGNALFSKDGKNISSFDEFQIGDTFTAIIVTNSLDNLSSGGKLLYADDSTSSYGTRCPITYGTLLKSQYNAKKTDRFLWRFKCVEKKNGHGVFTICNLHTNNYFIDANTPSDNGTTTHLWTDGNNSATTTSSSSYYNRKWLIDGGFTAGGKTLEINTKIYHIDSNNSVSNFVLSVDNVANPNGKIITWTEDGGPGQIFHILPLVHTDRVADTYGSAPNNFTSTFSTLSGGQNLNIGEKQASGFILSTLSAPSTSTDKCLFDFKGWYGDDNALCWSINHTASKISMDLRGGLNGNNVQIGFYESHGDIGAPQRWFLLYPMDGSGGFYLSSICYASDMGITIAKYDRASNELKMSNKFAEGDDNLIYFTPKSPSLNYVDTLDTSDGTVLGTGSVSKIYHNIAYDLNSSLYEGYTLSHGDSIVVGGRDKDGRYNSNITVQRSFKKNTYTVTFIPNGGTGEIFSQNYTCFEGDFLPDTTFSNQIEIKYIFGSNIVSKKLRLNFKGWNTKADGSGQNYTDNAYVNNLTLTNGGNINLYAQWEAQKVDFPIVSKAEYDFLGWSDNSNLSGTTVLENGSHFASSSKNYYAYWYTIDQNWNEGSTKTLNIKTDVFCNDTIQKDAEILYTVNQLTKDGKKQLLASQGADIAFDLNNAGAGNALECVMTLKVGNICVEKSFISALCVGDTLVDRNAYTSDENKEYCAEYTPFILPKISSIKGKSTVEYIYATSDIISGIKFGDCLKNASFDYKLYGVWGEDRIAVMSSLDNERNGFFYPDDSASYEGASFDYYILSITNNSPISITLSQSDILLLSLPRIYKFDLSEIGCDTFYLTSMGQSSFSPRTFYKGEAYFYEDDSIRIAVPVREVYKVAAGSYILFNGEKVYPTFSCPVDGYVYFDYKNYYEFLTGRDKCLQNIKIDMADYPAELHMEIVPNDSNESNFNFAPLGVKYNKELTSIRFGALWYLDNIESPDSLFDKSNIGSLIIDLKNILSVCNSTNDFYVYLTTISGGNAVIEKWKEYSASEYISDEGESYILPYMSDFIESYNQKGSNKKLSFGVSSLAYTDKFYYVTDENGNKSVEYSFIISVDDANKRTSYICIPYIECEKDASISYMYAAPERSYSYADFDPSPADQNIILAQKGSASNYKIVYSQSDAYHSDVTSILQNAFKAEIGTSPALLLDTSGSGNYEIILNSAARGDCKTLMNTLGTSEYAIKTVRTASKTYIILVYKDYASAMKCVEHFVEEYIEGDGDIISVPANINVKGSCTQAEISSQILIGTGVYNLRDPSIFYENGVYYMYGTGWGCYTATNLKGPWTYRGVVAKDPSDIYYDGAPLPAGVSRPSWAQKWAPEVYKYNGKYYMFTTYFSIKTYHRGCVIMVADSPLGPFVPTTDGHITRSDWDCIDGTLYVDEGGQPWMMFVHEWTCQADGIGSFAVARLSDDFTRLISEPIELFKANSVTWDASCVTDGCYVRKCEDGSLLMIWSNFCGSDYVVAVAKSPSGNICGPWIHEEDMLFSKNEIVKNDGGHGMFFEDDSGQLYMILHSPNTSTTSNPTQSVLVRIEEKYGLIYWDFYKKK